MRRDANCALRTTLQFLVLSLLVLSAWIADDSRANAGIIDLQPAVTTTTQTYQHTFVAGVNSADPNAMLHNVAGSAATGMNASFAYFVQGGNQQGSVIYNFDFSPPTDKPNAILQSISVTSHSNDFGTGFAKGQFWTDRMTTPVEFFNTNTDGSGFVIRNLGNYATVTGASSLQLIYTADLGGQPSSNQQLLGAHIATVPSTSPWTFNVTANWVDSATVYTPITVRNPSFELETVGDGAWSPSNTPLHGASWNYAPGNFRVHDPGSGRFAGAGGDNGNSQNVIPHGGQILNLDSTFTTQTVGSITQLTEYMLNFWIGTAADTGFNVPGTFEAVLMDDGVAFATLAAGAPLPGTFKQFTLLGETLAGASGNLSIGFRTTGNTVWLDDVELFSRSLLVPEPASLLGWMIAGMVAIGAARTFRTATRSRVK